MKRKLSLFVIIMILMLSNTIPIYAQSDNKSTAIQAFLDEAVQKSGAPGMSVSVQVKDEVQYFSSGYANREEEIIATEDTLYELGSVSKAFTAYGILLLEEQGLLSMNDSVKEYLPWFTLQLNGEPVDMDKITLNHLLYHTSGLVNSKHDALIPRGEGPEMLKKTVEALTDAELAFAPGERYEYGTMNYDILALVTATVSEQSWEDYMQTQVLEPLGLHDTYMYQQEAAATDRLAKGYSPIFLRTVPFNNAPVYDGNKPAGYIISSVKDMARWTGIQLGVIDVPEPYRSVVEKSHQGNLSNLAMDDLYYAAGWLVNESGSYVEHSGGNPSFQTDVLMYPEEGIAVCALINSTQSDPLMITKSIKNILDGVEPPPYTDGQIKMLDQMGTWITVIAGLLTVLFIILGIRRWRHKSTSTLKKRRVILIIIWGIITVAMLAFAWMLPAMFGSVWVLTIENRFYSMLTACITLVLASGSITWFVFAKRKE